MGNSFVGCEGSRPQPECAYAVIPPWLFAHCKTGKVQLGERLEYGQVTRDDVAAVIAECLTANNSIGKACDLMNGDTPIAEAVATL